MNLYFIITIVTAVILAIIPASIAAHKGKNFIIWYIYGLLLWIIAFIHSIILPSDNSDSNNKFYITVKKLYKKYEEIILYLFFGVLTTIVSVALYALLVFVFDKIALAAGNQDLRLANNLVLQNVCLIFKNVVAILFAYVTNRIFVFKSKVRGFKAIFAELVRFFAARLSTLVFELVFMSVTVNGLHYPELVMNIIAQFVIVVLNYVFSKLWIFRKKKSE